MYFAVPAFISRFNCLFLCVTRIQNDSLLLQENGIQILASHLLSCVKRFPSDLQT